MKARKQTLCLTPRKLSTNGFTVNEANTPTCIDGPTGQDHDWPISYMRSTTSGAAYMAANITLNYGGPGGGPHWQLEGTAEGYTFGPVIVHMGAGNNTFNLPCATALPNTIQSQTLDITWKLATVNGGAFFTVGESKNHLFVTGGSAAGAYETMLWIGCGYANNLSPHFSGELEPGASGADQQIINAVWGAFTGRSVKRVDGTLLTYYHDYNTQVTSAGMLLQTTDGQCGSWTSLLIDILYYQGVGGMQYIFFSPVHADGFLVNNWTFDPNGGHSGNPVFPYLNVCVGGSPINAAGNGYAWSKADVQQGNGVAGQGNPRPASLFNNHQVLEVTNALGTTYYDPSYGVTYSSTADFDNKAVAGFWNAGTALFNGVNSTFFEIQKNPAGNQIQQTLGNQPFPLD